MEEEEEVEHEADDPGVDGFDAASEDVPVLRKVLQLKAPVDTRWSSTFYMIQRCVFVYWRFHVFHILVVTMSLWLLPLKQIGCKHFLTDVCNGPQAIDVACSCRRVLPPARG